MRCSLWLANFEVVLGGWVVLRIKGFYDLHQTELLVFVLVLELQYGAMRNEVGHIDFVIHDSLLKPIKLRLNWIHHLELLCLRTYI